MGEVEYLQMEEKRPNMSDRFGSTPASGCPPLEMMMSRRGFGAVTQAAFGGPT